MTTYEFHPYTAFWPQLEGDNFEELALDIAANGLIVPILLYEGKILDGRNRYLACQEAGVEPRFEQSSAANDEQAIDLVTSLNTKRRHLTNPERANAAAHAAKEKITLKHGGDRRSEIFNGASASLKGQRTVELTKAAKQTGTSYGSASRALTILTHAPEKMKDVLANKASLTATAEAVRPPRKPRVVNSTKATNQKKSATIHHLPLSTKVVKALKPHEVDPEFVGTPLEFVDKYGHVLHETAEQIATRRFALWTIQMGGIVAQMKRDPPPEVDLNWLRSPKERDVQKGREVYDKLAPIIEAFKQAVEKAEASRSQKTSTG